VGITAGSREVPGRKACDRRHTYRIIIIIIIITVFPRDIICLRNISINTLHKGDYYYYYYYYYSRVTMYCKVRILQFFKGAKGTIIKLIQNSRITIFEYLYSPKSKRHVRRTRIGWKCRF